MILTHRLILLFLLPLAWTVIHVTLPPAVVLNKPEVVNVTLTITTKAKEMLDSAFDGDMSHLYGSESYPRVVPDTCMIYKS